MRRVKALVFRYLTDADFFNMYKPPGTEVGGGGQLYIDFRTTVISIVMWNEFFDGVTGLVLTAVRRGPEWDFPIYSIGFPQRTPTQRLRIYQRREASVCIPNQNINTRGGNRVRAWDPARGFPEPPDPTERRTLPAGLAVYLVRTYDDTIWAGWFSNHASMPSPCQDAASSHLLSEMLAQESEPGHVGFMSFEEDSLLIDEANCTSPFHARRAGRPLRPRVVVTTLLGEPHRAAGGRSGARMPERHVRAQRRQRTEEEVTESLFGEDEDRAIPPESSRREVLARVRQRNLNATRDLKELYEHKCQISGSELSFLKRDAVPYTEVHHLIPLGEGGADDPRNMIVVNPLIHRMLHHANVSPIDLSQIRRQADGSAALEIEINNRPYTIRWKRQHAERVLRHQT